MFIFYPTYCQIELKGCVSCAQKYHQHRNILSRRVRYETGNKINSLDKLANCRTLISTTVLYFSYSPSLDNCWAHIHAYIHTHKHSRAPIRLFIMSTKGTFIISFIRSFACNQKRFKNNVFPLAFISFSDLSMQFFFLLNISSLSFAAVHSFYAICKLRFAAFFTFFEVAHLFVQLQQQ